MPRLAEKSFTDLYLKNLKPGQHRKDYYDAAQRGWAFASHPPGSRHGSSMRRVNARMTRKTLGRYPELSLSEARIKAGELLSDMAKGRAPVRRTVPVFSAVMTDWFEKDQKGKRGVAEKRRALSVDVLPRLGPLPIDAIGRSDIRSILDSIVARGAPIHANRVLAYLRRLFNWAVERDIIAVSPAEKIKAPTAERSRDRTLTAAELVAVWNAASNSRPAVRRIRSLADLDGQRLSEVAGARWTEFDFERGEWTIPGSRAKNGMSAYRTPGPGSSGHFDHSPAAQGQRLRIHDDGYDTDLADFRRRKSRLDQASGVKGWTFHDLRRTFATIGTGELGIDPVVMDKILNHRSGIVTGVAAVYQRHAYLQQRRVALMKWADYVERLTAQEATP